MKLPGSSFILAPQDAFPGGLVFKLLKILERTTVICTSPASLPADYEVDKCSQAYINFS